MNKIQEFFNCATILDTETTGVDFKKDEIVEVAGGRYTNGKWDINNILMGATIPMPPGASAVNNISNKMIAGLPTFDACISEINNILLLSNTKYMVAHNTNFDRRILVAAYDRCNNADFNEFKVHEDWICTWKLSQQLFPQTDGSMKYSLAFMRYYLDLDIDDAMMAHRADADVYMCGKLLERLIEVAAEQGVLDLKQDIGPQLQQLCWKPLDITLWPLGKHKGKKIVDVPTDYLLWCVDKIDLLDSTHTKYDKDLTRTVEKVLESRL